MSQTRTDSVMESLTNIVIGMGVSYGANLVILTSMLDVELDAGTNLTIGAFYTVVSLVRSYLLRRAFNGRSVWAAIRARVNRHT